MSALIIDSIETAVGHILDKVQGDIVLGIPLGVGKPNPLVNALYRRIKATPERKLKIVTALSLQKPAGRTTLERNFLKPLVDRVFADYPDLDYVRDLRAGQLPPNIEVLEFFLKTGDYIGNQTAQMSYISTNYTFVGRDLMNLGMNVVAQAVACRVNPEGTRYSLSSNPDLTHEFFERSRDMGTALLSIAVVNHNMPFMPNGAEVGPDLFDIVVTDPAGTHALFAPPNAQVTLTDYAIGLHASSLVSDGGTLQIGIGSLGDAIGQALIVRDRHSAQYQRILETLCPNGLEGRELGRFEEGLYGCSEMFVNAFLKLIDAGIIRREVFDDAALQSLLNSGASKDDLVTPDMLRALLDIGRIRSPLSEEDLAFLRRFGIFRQDAKLSEDDLVIEGLRLRNDLRDADSFDRICGAMLGARLTGGIVMTGGFFLGPRDFYERLRSMPSQDLAKINMTRIDSINHLHGGDAVRSAQRRKARFMNTTMIVSLLGAASSDSLESGQVVSGVGGQYNFVAMSHALPDAQSIIMLRSTRQGKEGLKSSIVWNYGSVTIPRHLRDVVITEYGVADLRGQPDGEVVKRLIAIADSRFQGELIKQAQAHGKLEAGYQLPACHTNNFPDVLRQKLLPWMKAGVLPDFPFGTDLTDEERHMAGALKKVKHASGSPRTMVKLLANSVRKDCIAPAPYLARLGLDKARTPKDRVIRRLFSSSL